MELTKHRMTAKISARVSPFALLAVVAFCFIAGCGEVSSSDFKSYGEVGRQTATETLPDSPLPVGLPIEANAAPMSVEPAKPASKENTESVAAKIPEKLQTDTAVQTPPKSPAVGSSRNPLKSSNQKSAARKVEVLIKSKEFRTEGPEGAIRVSYDDIDLLKVMNMEPVTPNAPQLMPKWLKELDGKRIRIRGFMFPTYSETGLRGFALARDNQICCFVRKPKIYDVFEVALRKGTTTDYIPNRPFDLVGVFHIRLEVEDGEFFQLYQIDDAIVIDK